MTLAGKGAAAFEVLADAPMPTSWTTPSAFTLTQRHSEAAHHPGLLRLIRSYSSVRICFKALAVSR